MTRISVSAMISGLVYIRIDGGNGCLSMVNHWSPEDSVAVSRSVHLLRFDRCLVIVDSSLLCDGKCSSVLHRLVLASFILPVAIRLLVVSSMDDSCRQLGCTTIRSDE